MLLPPSLQPKDKAIGARKTGSTTKSSMKNRPCTARVPVKRDVWRNWGDSFYRPTRRNNGRRDLCCLRETLLLRVSPCGLRVRAR
jgi:hypothetical protein